MECTSKFPKHLKGIDLAPSPEGNPFQPQWRPPEQSRPTPPPHGKSVGQWQWAPTSLHRQGVGRPRGKFCVIWLLPWQSASMIWAKSQAVYRSDHTGGIIFEYIHLCTLPIDSIHSMQSFKHNYMIWYVYSSAKCRYIHMCMPSGEYMVGHMYVDNHVWSHHAVQTYVVMTIIKYVRDLLETCESWSPLHSHRMTYIAGPDHKDPASPVL